MARSDTRYSIYPAPKAVEIVGGSSPDLNQAIECWAAQLARAMADNNRIFSKCYCYFDLGGDEHGLHDWGLLATVLHDMRFDPEFANPAELLATAVEDAHRLENIGLEWCDVDSQERMDCTKQVANLAEKLRKLDYTHAWAIIGVVKWFWEHQAEGIDIKKDEWWTLAFRRQWTHTATQKKDLVAGGDKQKAKLTTQKKKRGSRSD